MNKIDPRWRYCVTHFKSKPNANLLYLGYQNFTIKMCTPWGSKLKIKKFKIFKGADSNGKKCSQSKLEKNIMGTI